MFLYVLVNPEHLTFCLRTIKPTIANDPGADMFPQQVTQALPQPQFPFGDEDQTLPSKRNETDLMILRFHAGELKVLVKEGQEVVLGRYHVSNPQQPEIDLTRFGASACGISRLHAIIRHDKNGWWIKDLASSNGTWVERKRLEPFGECRLEKITPVLLANLEVCIAVP
jgi:hypothetical protein